MAEVVNARIYDGVHYRTSGEAGAAMGRKIGEYTVQNYLKPVRYPAVPWNILPSLLARMNKVISKTHQ